MITVAQNQLVDLLCEKLKFFALDKTSGTYNPADPTRFEKYSGSVNGIQFEVYDNTWTVGFSFTTDNGTVHALWFRPIGDTKTIYGRWDPQIRLFFSVARQLLTTSTECSERDDSPCMACGCSGCNGRCQE